MYARRKTAALLVLVMTVPSLAACDSEDVRDVKEGVEDIEREVNEGSEKLERELDKADTDGQDE